MPSIWNGIQFYKPCKNEIAHRIIARIDLPNGVTILQLQVSRTKVQCFIFSASVRSMPQTCFKCKPFRSKIICVCATCVAGSYTPSSKRSINILKTLMNGKLDGVQLAVKRDEPASLTGASGWGRENDAPYRAGDLPGRTRIRRLLS